MTAPEDAATHCPGFVAPSPARAARVCVGTSHPSSCSSAPSRQLTIQRQMRCASYQDTECAGKSVTRQEPNAALPSAEAGTTRSSPRVMSDRLSSTIVPACVDMGFVLL